MALGGEVGLDPSDIVLDGDQAPLKRAEPPIFGPCLLWPTSGWIKMPLSTKVGLSPGHNVLDGDPASQGKGHSSLHFWPMSIVDKRLYGSR